MRAYLRLGLFFYFKKIEVKHANRIPKSGAVLFLGNHQNALLDALLIATKNGRFSYFLTRASVFSKPLISKVLKSLLMLPVYRIRDGWSNLTKNNRVFSKSSKLLSEGHAITIFPEGSHNLRRTVRPLSKGFTRIIFETLEAYPDTIIHLVPVGLNFKNATKFGDSTLINFGNVMSIDTCSIEDKSARVLELKSKVFDQLCKLTTHIETENYEQTLEALEAMNVDFLKPERVNSCIANNFSSCEKGQLKKDSPLKVLSKFLLILCLFLPYFIWKKVAQPKIKEIEFTATFRFAIAITLVPIFIIVIMLILTLLMQFQIALLYLIIVLALALISIKL